MSLTKTELTEDPALLAPIAGPAVLSFFLVNFFIPLFVGLLDNASRSMAGHVSLAVFYVFGALITGGIPAIVYFLIYTELVHRGRATLKNAILFSSLICIALALLAGVVATFYKPSELASAPRKLISASLFLLAHGVPIAVMAHLIRIWKINSAGGNRGAAT